MINVGQASCLSLSSATFCGYSSSPIQRKRSLAKAKIWVVNSGVDEQRKAPSKIANLAIKNFVSIPIRSVTFSSRKISSGAESRMVYDGTDEFIQQRLDRLRLRLQQAGVDCAPSIRSFKPSGYAFCAGPPDKRIRVVVSLEGETLPNAVLVLTAYLEVSLWDQLFRFRTRARHAQKWNWFEPLLKGAIQSEFPDSDSKWMNENEFIESAPASPCHEDLG